MPPRKTRKRTGRLLTAAELYWCLQRGETVGVVPRAMVDPLLRYKDLTREAMFLCERLLPLRVGTFLDVTEFRAAIRPLLERALLRHGFE